MWNEAYAISSIMDFISGASSTPASLVQATFVLHAWIMPPNLTLAFPQPPSLTSAEQIVSFCKTKQILLLCSKSCSGSQSRSQNAFRCLQGPRRPHPLSLPGCSDFCDSSCCWFHSNQVLLLLLKCSNQVPHSACLLHCIQVSVQMPHFQCSLLNFIY